MSLASSSPKMPLDRTCNNTVKAENPQPCNATDDNQAQDCYETMHAFKKIRTSTSGLRKSPNKWTKEENQKLASLVASYGEKKWKRISAEMGGQKTGAQCAQHWKRVLSPEIRKGHWDENEEDLLLRLVVQYGSCWKKIAKKIPQRTDIQCRYQYLKAKQSREVMWDAKEDESLIKKVMEMANCNFFHLLNGNDGTTTSTANSNATDKSPNESHSPSLNSIPLRGSSNYNTASPAVSSPLNISFHSPDVPNKENDDSGLSSSSGSESKDDDRMKSSGECGKDAWNDDKQNVNMSDSSTPEIGSSSWRSNSTDSSKEFASSSDTICSNCHNPVGSHVNKVVWLEISEHMARLKLTSTLRTALECKTRFNELLGNKISFASPNNFCFKDNLTSQESNISKPGLKHSGDIGRNAFGNPLGSSGGMGPTGTDNRGFHNSLSDANNIGIKINKNTNSPSGYTGSNINLTNCNNNNITINITNSYTTTNTHQNGNNFQQIAHCNTSPASLAPIKSDLTSPNLLPKNPVPPILSPAPPFPSFSHMSHPSFPHLPPPAPLKPASRNVHNGLESLAAVASILPREMLADYAQY